jgi:hypothetical protein
MNMLGHDNITANKKAILAPHSLQRLLASGTGEGRMQSWESPVTAERDEVEMTGLLEALQSSGHVEIVLSPGRTRSRSKTPP